MMPSLKNPGCSSPRYIPPKRESIKEHLVVASARVKMPKEGWQPKTATVPFVEDLVKRQIIGGPYRVKKSSGRGWGRRLKPRDYRDLLRIVRLKCLEITRTDFWILHLWLHGRDYPPDVVARAFFNSLGAFLDEAKRDLSPRDRWKLSEF